MAEYQIRAVEVDVETVQVVLVYEPRITQSGRPVGETKIVTIDRGDESVAPLVESLLNELRDHVDDILAATSQERTQSLGEYEQSLDELDDDLGLGDDN